MRDLPNLGDKNKEPPLCYPYSIKARALIHAHLSRLELPRLTLKTGRAPGILQGSHAQEYLTDVLTHWLPDLFAKNAFFDILSIWSLDMS